MPLSIHFQEGTLEPKRFLIFAKVIIERVCVDADSF
ncbi:hypothetical protein ACVWWO_006991 [Bradyrhizobium sp. F1.13.1]